MFHHHAHADTPAPSTADSEAQALQRCIDLARTFTGLTDGPLALKPGEHRFFTLEGAQLVEPRRGPSHRVGAYAGPSVRVARGMYLHAGGYGGKTIPGKVTPTVIDAGTTVVTDQRVVFLGEKVTRELDWSKMLSYDHDAETCSTAFHVSNRQVVDAVRWGNAGQFILYCDLAHAHYAGTVEAFVAELESELRTVRAGKPGR